MGLLDNFKKQYDELIANIPDVPDKLPMQGRYGLLR